MGDREPVLPDLRDRFDQLGLLLRQVHCLSLGLPVQGLKEPGSLVKVIPGSNDTCHPVNLLLLPLVLSNVCIFCHPG